MSNPPLTGKVAVVAGSARGAGRGIAAMLGAAGATVYCTARSIEGHLSDPKRPETIDETAALVTANGGEGIAVRIDHTIESEVERLFDRVRREQGRLDIMINNVNADALYEWKPFWKMSLEKGRKIVETAIHAHIVNAHFAVPLMRKAKKGLIVEITDGDGLYYRGHLYYDLTKTNAIRLATAFAYELRKQNIAAVAVTPGFLRSEAVLDVLHVREENWRDAVPERPEFEESETPFFAGRAIAALAADPQVMKKSGRVFNSHELAAEYGLTDVDGRRPNVWRFIAEKMPQFRYKKLDDVFYTYVDIDLEAYQKELASVIE
ncbi:MAG TPA: SDR family oxidoreductase [Thermoanaerobaculia bacterium]|nr:SDR family oxidoreductase [Thermoanaerobaculia bacterium]